MRVTLLLVFLLLVGALAAGCGGGGSPENRMLTLGDIGCDESVAVANLS